MASQIPFAPGVPFQRIEITIDSIPVIIDARWNSRDEAFYLDIFQQDETVIARGLKVVLGASMGRGYAYASEFFQGTAMFAQDISGKAKECGIDDLGQRVVIWYLNAADVFVAQSSTDGIPAE